MQPSKAVLSMQASAVTAHGIADPEPDEAFRRFPRRLRRYECGRSERHSAERDPTSLIQNNHREQLFRSQLMFVTGALPLAAAYRTTSSRPSSSSDLILI